MPQERWQPSVRQSRYNRRAHRLPRLFSAGDSWFDYPPHANVIDFIDDTERSRRARAAASHRVGVQREPGEI